jgi:hypothetical protein
MDTPAPDPARHHAAEAPLLRRAYDRLARLFPRNPRTETVSTRMLLAATPEEVWDGILFYEEVPGTAPWHLRQFLPAPVRTEGDKRAVGAIIHCTYDRASLVKQITHIEHARLMRFDVLEQRLGVENAVTMGEGSYEIRPAGEHSEVILSTHYRGHVRPRWLVRWLEHHLAHDLHRFILGGMRAHIPRQRAAAPTGAVAESRGA